MPNKALFFRELARTLRPGGRAAIADWTIATDLSPLERVLLRAICRSGRLPSLGTLGEYTHLADSAGLHPIGHRDLTPLAMPTWRIIARRGLSSLFRNPRFLLASLQLLCRRPSLLLAAPMMLLAYRTGALRYGLLWLENENPAE
jgi:tocopherol O-methyltransferase